MEAEGIGGLNNYFIYRAKRVAIPVVTVGLALVARLWLEPVLHGKLPNTFFYVAIIVTAWCAGIWETLLAVVLGYLAAEWFVIEPRWTLAISGADEWLGTILYLFIGLAIVWFAKSEQLARFRELISAVEVRKRQEELERERDRNRQLQAVRESEARYRTLFEQASVGQAELDPATGRFLLVNSKMCEITGYSAGELLQKTEPEITLAEDRERDRQRAEDLAQGKIRGYHTHKRYLRKGGGAVWVNLHAAAGRANGGRALRAIGVVEDPAGQEQARSA